VNHANKEPCELAEIVFEKPLAGAFEEVSFGSDKGNTLWIKFSDKDGCGEWIGRFGVGSRGPERVVKIAEPDRFFISAGGFAYVFDATRREIVFQYGDEFLQDIIYDTERSLIITAHYTRLCWVNHEGKTLEERHIAVDGIRDLKIAGRVLTGLAYRDYGSEKEERFWLDLDELKILRWEKMPSNDRGLKKPWWKFW